MLILSILFGMFGHEKGIWVGLSFLAHLITLGLIGYYHLFKEKIFSPFIGSYLVFWVLFFYYAPIAQMGGMGLVGYFPNTLPFNSSSVIGLNWLLSVWNLVFFFSYLVMKKIIFGSREMGDWRITTRVSKYANIQVLVLTSISVVIVLLFWEEIIHRLNFKEYPSSMSKTMMLLVVKSIFSIPYISLLLGIHYLQQKGKLKTSFYYVIALTILSLITFLLVKNPFMDKRNALGPLYISILLLLFPRLLNSNRKYVGFMFMAMVIAFPLVSIFTHARGGILSMIKKPSIILDRFSSDFGLYSELSKLHYDSYSNILAVMNYISEYDVIYLKQILGVFFFFIPRSIWVSKPIGSGELIGEYLVENYDMWFSNISCPLVGESLLNLGYLGIIVFPITLAFFIIMFLKMLYSKDFLKQVLSIYFAIHLLFLLRGDLMNGWAYFFGTFVGIYAIPKLINFTGKLISVIYYKYLPDSI